MGRDKSDGGQRRVEEGLRRAGDGDEAPQKRFFRQRAHINPLSFTQSYD